MSLDPSHKTQARDVQSIVAAGPYLGAGIVIIAFLIFRYWRGEASHIQIFDYLDGRIPRYRALAEAPLFGALDYTVDAFLGGIGRNFLPSSLTLPALLHRVFSVVGVAAAEETLMRSIAFIGMVRLQRIFYGRAMSHVCISLVALAFALLPFWPGGFLSIAGLPLFASVYITILKARPKFLDILTLALIPFSVPLTLFGWCHLLLLGLIAGGLCARRSGAALRFIVVTLCLSALYAALDYRLLINSFLGGAPQSHREAFTSSYFSQFALSIIDLEFPLYVLRVFMGDHPHRMQLIAPVLLTAVLIVMGLIFFGPKSSTDESRQLKKNSGILLSRSPTFVLAWFAIAILFCTAVAVAEEQNFVKTFFLRTVGGFFGTISYGRIAWFQPALWYALFSYVLYLMHGFFRIVIRGRPIPRWIFPSCLAAIQCVLLIQYGVRRESENPSRPIHRLRALNIPFDAFESRPLFDEISEQLGRSRDSYRVGALGLYPSVLQLNGFQTVGAYAPSYPLAYKNRFRKLIAEEIDGSPRLQIAFDSWGSKCYILTRELGWEPFIEIMHRNTHPYYHSRLPSSINVNLSAEAMVDLGLDYIFSAVPIDNPEQSGLTQFGRFAHEDAAWKIWVYETSTLVEPSRTKLNDLREADPSES